jgi:hypothetical protein
MSLSSDCLFLLPVPSACLSSLHPLQSFCSACLSTLPVSALPVSLLFLVSVSSFSCMYLSCNSPFLFLSISSPSSDCLCPSLSISSPYPDCPCPFQSISSLIYMSLSSSIILPYYFQDIYLLYVLFYVPIP